MNANFDSNRIASKILRVLWRFRIVIFAFLLVAQFTDDNVLQAQGHVLQAQGHNENSKPQATRSPEHIRPGLLLRPERVLLRKRKPGLKPKKGKKKKGATQKGVSRITLNMNNREYRYNRKIKILKPSATVTVCNLDTFYYEPIAIGLGSDIFEYGEVVPGRKNCQKHTFVNDTGLIQSLKFYDSIHPDLFAPFCILPNTSCVGGAALEDEYTDSCELTETCCTDGNDNDGDGDVDCFDTDCLVHPSCKKKNFLGSVVYQTFTGKNSFEEPTTTVVAIGKALKKSVKALDPIACTQDPFTDSPRLLSFSPDPCAGNYLQFPIVHTSCASLISSNELGVILTSVSFVDITPTAQQLSDAYATVSSLFSQTIVMTKPAPKSAGNRCPAKK